LEVIAMENKTKGIYNLTIELTVGLIDIVVTVISIIVTVISIKQTAGKDRHQKSNRHSAR
jgi:hypothetical protein